MSQEITSRLLSAFAKLDLSEMSHAQRLEALAKASGFSSYAALKAQEKKAKQSDIKPFKEDAASFVTVVAFGEDLTRTIDASESLYDRHGDFVGGSIEEHSFRTLGELKAYHQGLADMDGWMAADTLVSQDHQPDHDYLAALKVNPKLTFEAFYEAGRQAEIALDDYDMDEDVIGFQVVDPATQKSWNDLPNSKVLSLETATAHSRAARRAGRFEYVVRQVKKGEIENPILE